MIDSSLPEAPITMFTNYKRLDGFEVSLTVRGRELRDVATELNNAIETIVKAGGTPVARQKQGFPQKVKEYIEGRTCPNDGGRLIKPEAGTKKPIKCENSKWNPTTKQAYGCQYIEWPNPRPQQSPVIGREEVEDFNNNGFNEYGNA